MRKAQTRRKEEAHEDDQNGHADDTKRKGEEKSGKKLSKSHSNDAVKSKKEKTKKAKSSTLSMEEKPPKSKSSNVNGIQMDSLQSIFSIKDSSEGTFTLFGGEPITESLPEPPPLQRGPASALQSAVAQHGERKILYFFPHFEDPEKNTLSLFPVSDEPFFHNRTEFTYL